MTTQYIRDVPDEVAETLKERAAAEGKSLSAYLGAELTKDFDAADERPHCGKTAGSRKIGGPHLR